MEGCYNLYQIYIYSWWVLHRTQSCLFFPLSDKHFNAPHKCLIIMHQSMWIPRGRTAGRPGDFWHWKFWLSESPVCPKNVLSEIPYTSLYILFILSEKPHPGEQGLCQTSLYGPKVIVRIPWYARGPPPGDSHWLVHNPIEPKCESKLSDGF